MFLFIICIDDTITMDGTDRMISCDGGVYRWTYEKSLYSDLSILFLILKIFKEYIQDFISHHRIKSCGGFIHNEEFCIMRKSSSNLKLHLHSF